MSWQDRAHQSLGTEELAANLAKLSVISEHTVEQETHEKSEETMSTELRKAASILELKPHLFSWAQSPFCGLHNKDCKHDEMQRWGNNVPHCSEYNQYSVHLPPQSDSRKDTIPVVAAVQEVPSLKSVGMSYLRQRKLSLRQLYKQRCAARGYFGMHSVCEDNTCNLRMKMEKKGRKLDSKKNLMKSKIAKSQLELQLKENEQKKMKLRLDGKIFGSQHSHTGSANNADCNHKRFESKSEYIDGERLYLHFKRKMRLLPVKTIKMRAKDFDKHQGKKLQETGAITKMEPKLNSGKNESQKSEPDDDLCSAANCLRPISEIVSQIMCDGDCEQLFHLQCIGLDYTEADEIDYICPNCANQEGGEKRHN